MEAPVESHGVKEAGFLMTVNSPSLLSRLKLPKNFVEDQGKELSNFAILRLPGGTEWPVQVIKYHGRVFFTTGWSNLAHNYSITCNYKLGFAYRGISPTGASRFRLQIYQPNGSEINYQFPPPNHGTQQQSDTTAWTGKKTSGECKAHKVDTKVAMRTKSGLEWAKAFRSANPHFIIQIRKRNMSYNTGPVLPRDHIRTHFNDKDGYGNLILVVDNKSWSVQYRVEKMHKYSRALALGWKEFALGNKLQQGDVCVFEMIKTRPNTYRVHFSPVANTLTSQTAMKKKAEAFVGESPGFIKCVTQDDVYSAGVPPDHSKSYMNFINLVIAGEGQKSWKVQCCQDESYSALGVGWIQFRSENHLEIGDFCAFKMVDKINKLFEVAIFRVNAK